MKALAEDEDVTFATQTVKPITKKSWSVTYKKTSCNEDEPAVVNYRLRPKARWHPPPKEGLNSVGSTKIQERSRDFHGPVLYSTLRAAFPGDGTNKKAVTATDAGLGSMDFGIGFRYADMSKGTSLRRFVDKTFKL